MEVEFLSKSGVLMIKLFLRNGILRCKKEDIVQVEGTFFVRRQVIRFNKSSFTTFAKFSKKN